MSNSPGKPAPSKPPRVKKTVSVPYDVSYTDITKSPPHKQDTPPKSSSSFSSSNIQKPSAAAKVIMALKMASEREKANLGTRSSVGVQGSTSSVPQDSIDTADRDTVPVSDNIGERNTTSTPSETKKTPLLPPSIAIPSKPKPPPVSGNTIKEELGRTEVSDDNDDAFEQPSPSPKQVYRSPKSRNQLLLPDKARAVSLVIPNDNHTPSPPHKRTCRSESHDVPPPTSSSKKPLPLPRTKSHDPHVIAPEDPSNPPLDISSSDSTVSEEDAGLGLVQCSIEPKAIPISPSSTSSGIPEDPTIENPSPYSTESRGTTPSGLTSSEIFADDVKTDSQLSSNPMTEETDGRVVAKPFGRPRPKKPAQRRVLLKEETSWIKKGNDEPSPPPSPSKPPLHSSISTSDTKPSMSKPARPYRSVAILPDKQVSTSSLLKDTSKPVVGPSGIYYPPAVKEKSPDPLEQVKGSELSLRKTQSNELINVVNKKEDIASEENQKIPKRFKRSSSFNGEKKLRPVSLMNGAVGANKSAKEQMFSSTTMSRAMMESAKEEMVQQEKKPKSSGRKGVLQLFTRRKGSVPKSSEDDTGSSSDDEVGGTIKRMPKQPQYERKPWEPQVSDPDAADQYGSEYHQLFEYVFVIGLKEDRRAKKMATETTYRFPPASSEVSKDDALRSVDQFCFPDIDSWKPVLSYQSETYSFVLTSLDGSRRFGYCRRLLPEGKDARLPEVYCIVSPLGCFQLYSDILDYIEQRRAVSKAAVYSLLKAIIANPFPAPGRTVSIKVMPTRGGDFETVNLTRPHDSRLEHVDFAELYNTLGPKMLIQVFSSLLMERRVILAAQRLSTLSSCCHALLALLYPFEWQHTFIPVLPHSLIDFCGSPLPFIIGISPSMAKQLDTLDIEMEEALVVDLDKKRFMKKFGDESSILPNKVFQFLIHKLDARVIKTEYSKQPDQRSGQSKADKLVVLSFMTVFAYFFGELRSFLSDADPKTGIKLLQKSEFIKSFPSKSTRRFLEAFLLTQMFDKFIEERENPIKSAAVAEGLFEKKLPELMDKKEEIELFSSKKKFPWTKRKTVKL